MEPSRAQDSPPETEPHVSESRLILGNEGSWHGRTEVA